MKILCSFSKPTILVQLAFPMMRMFMKIYFAIRWLHLDYNPSHDSLSNKVNSPHAKDEIKICDFIV